MRENIYNGGVHLSKISASSLQQYSILCFINNRSNSTLNNSTLNTSKNAKYFSFAQLLNLVKSNCFAKSLSILLLSALILTNCSSNDLPRHWPSNGITVKSIKWEIPLSDSLNVLNNEGDFWKIPSLPEGTKAETTYTTYRTPQLLNYNEILGKVDQEAVHGNDTNIVEFYRFEKGSVLLLGYTNPDTSKPLTIIDPPLLVMPENINNLGQDIISTGTSKRWNRESFDAGFITTFTISKKQSGSIITENSENQQGTLCEMVITQDAGVPYGETNLILPDAITIKSNVLIIEGVGTILEWGIRGRKIETENEEKDIPERELYIEITRHIKENK